MNVLIQLALFLLTQKAVFFGQNHSNGSNCSTPPTMTADWETFAAGTTVAVNGSGVNNLTDVVAANNAVQPTGGLQPIYHTAQVNGLPATTFTAANFQVLDITTPIASTVTTYTFFAVVKPTAGGGNYSILGGNAGGMEWRINSSLHQELLVAGSVSLGAGTATLSTTNYTAIAAQFNVTSGAWALYTVSGGSVHSDGSGTTIGVPSQPFMSIGEGDSSDFFDGSIVQVGYLNGISTTGIGAYILACYAI